MRIAQIITGLNPAGAERIVSDLSRGLKAKGHEVLVVSLMPIPTNSPIPAELAEARLPVKTLNLKKTAPWALLKLPGLLLEFRPAVVHAHMFHANLASRIAGRDAGYRIVNTVHAVEPQLRKRWLLILDRLTRNRCDIYTAVSRAAQTTHARMVGIPLERIPIIHNGIVPPRGLDAGRIQRIRKNWGLEDCDLVLGAVGRLVREKRFDVLLRVLKRIVPSRTRTGLVILGEGPERPILERLAREATAPHITISLPGFSPDAPECVGAFDVLVVPSQYEGFGLVLVEGMAHGIRILANNVDTLVEVAEGYSHVRFVDFLEAKSSEIQAGLESLLEMEAPRIPLVRFSTDRMISEYLCLYESLSTRMGTKSAV